MTIQEFIQNPLTFNRGLTIRHVQFSLNLHQRQTEEILNVFIEGQDFYGDVEEWIQKEWREMVKSFENSTLDELNKAVDSMLSGWTRAMIMDEIDKRENKN